MPDLFSAEGDEFLDRQRAARTGIRSILGVPCCVKVRALVPSCFAH